MVLALFVCGSVGSSGYRNGKRWHIDVTNHIGDHRVFGLSAEAEKFQFLISNPPQAALASTWLLGRAP
jgi:hypothetical protein